MPLASSLVAGALETYPNMAFTSEDLNSYELERCVRIRSFCFKLTLTQYNQNLYQINFIEFIIAITLCIISSPVYQIV